MKTVSIISSLVVSILLFTSFTTTSRNAKTIKNTTITHGQAGVFTLNSPIPEGKYHEYHILRKDELQSTSEGEMIVKKYHCVIGDKTHMILIPKYDNENLIGEIHVLSNLYKTKEGIGVENTIDQFYTAYPKAEALYTYVSENYWLNTPKHKSIQFKMSSKDYLATPNFSSDLTELEKNKFKT
ncbi:MAG: hypothetical protein GY827_01200 [Cytophagales bacterium]|nr:hypothetical protein [Cytophagales bacterium]